MTALKPSARGTLDFIQILRGLAAVMIVVWHSDLALEKFHADYWRDVHPVFRAQLYPFWANHLNLSVDIFFCISGFIMTMLAARTKSAKDAVVFMRNRIARIMPPYWFFTFAIVGLYSVSSAFHTWRFVGDWTRDFPATLYSLFLLPIKDGPVLAVGWTLVHEFFFYYFVALVIALGFGRRLPYFLLAAAVIGVAFRLLGVDILNGYLLSDYYVEFFFGSLAFMCYKNTSRIFPALQLAIAPLCFVLLSYLLDRTLNTPAEKLLTVFGSGIVSYLLISGLAGLDAKHSISSYGFGRLWLKIGDASYSLYLSHWFTLSLIGKLAIPFADMPIPIIVLWHICSLFLTILVGLLFAQWVELPAHKKIVNALNRRRQAA